MQKSRYKNLKELIFNMKRKLKDDELNLTVGGLFTSMTPSEQKIENKNDFFNIRSKNTHSNEKNSNEESTK